MQRSLTLLAAALSAAGSWAQCPSIVGTYDGTPEPGNAHTPFATNTGSMLARGQRVQYIYPANELLAAGLCAGPITDVAFWALQTDVAQPGLDGIVGNGDDGPNTCALLADLRLGNSLLADFGPPVASSTTALSVDWDAAAEASANLHTNSSLPRTVVSGWISFPVAANGFEWDGSSNLIVDISWVRNFVNGLSPSVQLQEGLAYTATKWVCAASPNILHGNTYQDDPLSTNTTTGTTLTRPVTRFNNSAPAAVVVGAPTTVTQVLADETGQALIITRADAAKDWTVDLVDAAGRLIASERMAAGTTVVRIPMPTGHSGVVLAMATDASGERMMLGRAVFVQ